MTFQTFISQESLRHPIIDHLRVILTAWEPDLRFTMQRTPTRRPLRGGLSVAAKDGGEPLKLRKIRVERQGSERPSTLVTRQVHVNGHRALHGCEVVGDAAGEAGGSPNCFAALRGLTRPVDAAQQGQLSVDVNDHRALHGCEVVGDAAGEAGGSPNCFVAGGEAAGCGFVVNETDAATAGEAGGRGVVGAVGGEAGGLPNYFAAIDRLTGLTDVGHLSELCAGVVWDAIEPYRRHAREVLENEFPEAPRLRLCFCRSLKVIELAWDLPTGRAVTFDRLLEALHWCFPACSIRAVPQDWEVIVAAPLADLKFYWKEQPTDLTHNLIRCEAVLRNFNDGKTPRYRKQISRALTLFSRRHPDAMFAPTGVRFSTAVQLQRRVAVLAALVTEEYLSRLCEHSLDHSTADRHQATERAMAQATESFQHRSIRKVVALLGQYRGQIPTSKVHWKLKKRLIAEAILARRKWGRSVYLTVGSAVSRQLGIFGDVGTDDPNPKPYLDGHRITGWAHRVALAVNVA